MKKLYYLVIAFAGLSLAACSDDNDADTTPKFQGKTISFETSEGMKDIEGGAIALKSLSIEGGSAAGTHQNVLFAKGEPYSNYLDDKKKNFDGYLCSTADEKVWLGSYYIGNADYFNYGDFWAGFALTANYGKTATTLDYQNQFTVWANKGANNTANCAVAYIASYMGAYATPTIEFTDKVKLSHIYLANTSITHTYQSTLEDYYYKVIIKGYFEGEQTGETECMLIQNGQYANDWVYVDLSALGEVELIKFDADSNDKNSYGLLAPTYFAIDELGFYPVAQ